MLFFLLLPPLIISHPRATKMKSREKLLLLFAIDIGRSQRREEKGKALFSSCSYVLGKELYFYSSCFFLLILRVSLLFASQIRESITNSWFSSRSGMGLVPFDVAEKALRIVLIEIRDINTRQCCVSHSACYRISSSCKHLVPTQVFEVKLSWMHRINDNVVEHLLCYVTL